MAECPLDKAIEGLKKLIREKNDLSEVAAEKIEKLTAELHAVESPPPVDPIDKIIKGFTNFRINQFEQYPCFYEQLANDQKPHFLVFACSDSRVSPTFILNFLPGKAFMARNIANLVPAFNLEKNSGVGAIVEYAVTALKVQTILVIGHSRCGGIKRLMTMEDDPATQFDFIDDWVKIATPAKDYVNQNFPDEGLEARCALCEKVVSAHRAVSYAAAQPIFKTKPAQLKEAVNMSLENLQSYPYVKEGLEGKSLRLMGGYYDFVEGRFLVWPKGASDHPIIIPEPRP